MRKLVLAAIGVACALAPMRGQTPRRPKLVVTIVIDQFRYDYLTRFRSDYTGGLATLLRSGAVFTNAKYTQSPTVTAVGHSIILSGAEPAISGIVGNSWYSREERRVVTSVCDAEAVIVGRPGAPGVAEGTSKDCNDESPASPNRMLVDTVGDELRMASPDSRVIGISLKPRSAILLSGHMATGAYWFDDSGVFVSSSFYGPDVPQWVKAFNKDKPADQYASKEWMGNHFTSGAALYRQLPASPWGNELVENFAEAAVEGESLGKRGVTDLLTISFSSNDYVGHRVGPDDPEVRDMAKRTDHSIDRFFHFLAARGLGPNDVLVVLSADHGVAPLPEVDAQHKAPGGRMTVSEVDKCIQAALTARFGSGEWLVEKPHDNVIYMNREFINAKKLDPAEVDRVAAAALEELPHIFRVYTREQLEGGVAPGPIPRALVNGFFPRRSGELFVVLDPYWIFSKTGTTHGTPFNYDTHVPVILMGAGVKPGRYNGDIGVTDIAPTLSTLLGIQMPAGAMGRTLSEILSSAPNE